MPLYNPSSVSIFLYDDHSDIQAVVVSTLDVIRFYQYLALSDTNGDIGIRACVQVT